MKTATKELKITKKMEQIPRRYRIKLRDNNTVVTHLVTGQQIDCSPVVFALFELTVKAHHIGAERCADPELREYFRHGNRTLAARNGIELISADSIHSPETSEADYWWAVNQIKAAGLYFDLLD